MAAGASWRRSRSDPEPFVELFPHDSNFNFMRLRWVSLTIGALLMVVALVAIIRPGFNYALDFTGGTVTELKFQRPVEVEKVRKRLEAAGYHGAEVRTFGTGSEIVVRLPSRAVTEKQITGDAIQAAAQTSENAATLVRSDSVGPQIGKELAINGFKAAMFVVLGFLGYVWIRFEWKFAVAAILATLHDVLLCAGWFAISGHEFDLTVLAGILSVMGYSINDTIVVFDRVRENFRSLKVPAYEVLNRSVNQTLSRTIITSFVALLTVLALYFYGGSSLRGMAESQIIGIVIGTLSSIFIACPLLLWLGVTKQDLLPRAKMDAELARRP
jgi:preprotein translocase subunit SecF